jgi:hypothetical protein
MRTYPATASETQRLGWILVKKSLGWIPEYPPKFEGGHGSGVSLVAEVAGVTSIAKAGDPGLTGAVTLSPGANVTLTQTGQDIAITASASGGPFGGCAVFRTAATAGIVTATITPIIFDSEEFDDSGYHDNAVNPTRLTIPATGVYSVTGSAQWDANTTNQRGLWVQLNGTDTPTNRKGGQYRGGLAGGDMQDVALILSLTAGDFIELMAFQTSGANRTIVVTSSIPRFAIYRLA